MNQKIITVFVIGLVLVIGVSIYIQNTMTTDRHRDKTRDHHDDIATHEISPGEVVKKVRSNEGVILLDVRTPEEYEEVHLAGALLLPVQELSQPTLTSIGLGENMKDKEIIVYCRSGARSQTAYNVMKSLGYTNIKSVAGGMIHWKEDNYPLTTTGAYTGPAITSDTTDQTVVEGGSRIKIDRTVHAFGVIPQFGGIAETTFIISNSGTENLEIGQITTSCSCTSAKISDVDIDPGDEAILTVVFDPNFHDEPVGVFKRTIFIPTNDPTTSETEVAIEVDIAEGE